MATISDILLAQGQQAGNARRQQGQIRAGMWTNLADILAGSTQRYFQEKQDAPIRAQQAEMRDLQLQEARQNAGAAENAQKISQISRAWFDAHPNASMDDVRRFAFGTFGPETGAKLVDSWAKSMPEQPKAAEPFTLAPGQQRFDASGQPIASVPEPVKPEPLQRVVVKGPNGRPIVKMVPQSQLQQGVEEYVAPPTPDKPDFEWVTRNGAAVQIRKGTAQPGDAPYAPPRSTSETAQDRQRKGRLDSARQFLERLNELRDKINTKMGPEAGLTGYARQGAAAIGLDPDVAEYERVRAAGGRALAVAIMGAQNLSDADAAAWSNMLPGARIDKVTAKRLTDQIGKMLEETDTTASPTSGRFKVGDYEVTVK